MRKIMLTGIKEVTYLYLQRILCYIQLKFILWASLKFLS